LTKLRVECEQLEREQAILGPRLKVSEAALRELNGKVTSLMTLRNTKTAMLDTLRRDATEAERALAPTRSRAAAIDRECAITDDAINIANQRIARAIAAAAVASELAATRAGDRDSALAALQELEKRLIGMEKKSGDDTLRSRELAAAAQGAQAKLANAAARLALAVSAAESVAVSCLNDAVALSAVEAEVSSVAAKARDAEARTAAARAVISLGKERLHAAHAEARLERQHLEVTEATAAEAEVAADATAKELLRVQLAHVRARPKASLPPVKKANAARALNSQKLTAEPQPRAAVPPARKSSFPQKRKATETPPLCSTPPLTPDHRRHVEFSSPLTTDDPLFHDDPLAAANKRRKIVVQNTPAAAVAAGDPTSPGLVSFSDDDDGLFGEAPRAWRACF
jgi:hypothetical protein